MPRVKIILYFHLRKLVGEKEIQVEGNNVLEVLESLIQLNKDKQEELRKILFEKDGKLSPNYRVVVNGRNVSLLNGLSTSLKEGDEVVILPAIGGG